MASTTSWFWDERFWLPKNITWADIKSTDKVAFPSLEDFYIVIPLAVSLLVIRIIFERCVAMPVGHLLGIKPHSGPSSSYQATPNTILEKVFRSVSRNPDHKRLEGLAKQLDWSVRNVERWFRRRRNQDRPSILVKFSETFWRSVFYICVFSYGISTVPQEPWFWDLRLCWYQFPFHAVTSPIYNYYMVEMSFYLSLVLSLFTDVKRKDFVPQLVHHFATIFLMGFSWTCNFTRIGCIVLVTHDVADIFLETGKLCKYAQFEKAANGMFAVFTLTFFVSRIVIFPFWVLYSSLFQSRFIFGTFPAYYLLNGLLLVLQVLNLYWFILIANMVYKAVVDGQLKKDERSDVEESLSDSEMVGEETNGSLNHNHNDTYHVNSNSKLSAANHH